MTERASMAPKLAAGDKDRNHFFDLEDDLFDLHSMVQLAVMAAEQNDDVLTRFGVFQVEKMMGAFKRRYYDVAEKHVGRQSA